MEIDLTKIQDLQIVPQPIATLTQALIAAVVAILLFILQQRSAQNAELIKFRREKFERFTNSILGLHEALVLPNQPDDNIRLRASRHLSAISVAKVRCEATMRIYFFDAREEMDKLSKAVELMVPHILNPNSEELKSACEAALKEGNCLLDFLAKNQEKLIKHPKKITSTV